MVPRIRKLGQICYKTPIITLPHIDNVSHLSISSKEVPPLYPNRTLPPHTMQGCSDPTNGRLMMNQGRYPLPLVTTINCMWKSRNHTIKHNQKSNKAFIPEWWSNTFSLSLLFFPFLSSDRLSHYRLGAHHICALDRDGENGVPLLVWWLWCIYMLLLYYI